MRKINTLRISLILFIIQIRKGQRKYQRDKKCSLFFFLRHLVDFHFPVLSILEVFLQFELLPKRDVHQHSSDGSADEGDSKGAGETGKLEVRHFSSGNEVSSVVPSSAADDGGDSAKNGWHTVKVVDAAGVMEIDSVGQSGLKMKIELYRFNLFITLMKEYPHVETTPATAPIIIAPNGVTGIEAAEPIATPPASVAF